MRASTKIHRAARRAVAGAAIALTIAATPALAWPTTAPADTGASASTGPDILLVGDAWGARPGPAYGPPRPGHRPPGPPPPNWRPDRPGWSMYDKRGAADWGAAVAAGAVGLDAIDNWSMQNSGPPPGYYDQLPSSYSSEPDPNELGPSHPWQQPGADAIGPPSPTQQVPEQSGCYTSGPQLICPNY
ncbi:hypothetical protein [Amorphus orientalis]|uniref:Uncharacterized protein n=1 Tax=Amorphus orientalis TaxID=649198 RepID=A0AAE4ASK3_9HYPH|nr:hypothetical protein [Amorphus orientalis]MDQ0314054.1 hypothetical protein [Amorphus orientalis]